MAKIPEGLSLHEGATLANLRQLCGECFIRNQACSDAMGSTCVYVKFAGSACVLGIRWEEVPYQNALHKLILE